MDAEDTGDYGSDLDFIGRASQYRDEVENGTPFKISKYGLRLLDHHCPWKSSHLILNIGHPNVGKTVLDFYILVMLARTSNTKLLIYSAENRIAAMVKQIISMYYGRHYKTLSKTQKDEGFQWVDDHFMFILHIRMYTYKQILKMCLTVIDQKFEYDGVLIDPYNSLRLDLKRLNKNDYNIQACEEMRIFCEQTQKTILMNCHTTSESQRQRDKDGNVPRPMYSDVEGGGPFTAKADDVWLTHRMVRDSYSWMLTEFYVEKIRNQEYGGQITGFKEPILFRYRRDHSGFDIEPNAEERMQAQQADFVNRVTEPKAQQSIEYESEVNEVPF